MTTKESQRAGKKAGRLGQPGKGNGTKTTKPPAIDIEKLAPASAEAVLLTQKKLRKENVTRQEIADCCRGMEWRDLPEKLDVAKSLIESAWSLVHDLIQQGVKFAGTPRQATLIIAGTAYAAWRVSMDDKWHKDSAPQAGIADGVMDGLLFALWNKEGIPAMHGHGCAITLARSDDPIDKVSPLSLLGKLSPKLYSETGPRFAYPVYIKRAGEDGELWSDEFWEPVANVLTAPPEELRPSCEAWGVMCRRRAKKRQAAAHKAKAKPRAK